MAKAVEQCNGNQQCMIAIGMKMTGGGGLATLTWTVNGEARVPAPASFVDLCGSQLLLDTRDGTYDLSLELNPELEVRSTSPASPGSSPWRMAARRTRW